MTHWRAEIHGERPMGGSSSTKTTRQWVEAPLSEWKEKPCKRRVDCTSSYRKYSP